MRLKEDPIRPHSHGRAPDGLDQLRQSARHTRRQVRLLERVRDVRHHRVTKGLHAWDAAEVDHKVGVPKSRPALRQHHVRVARVDHLLRRKTHRVRRQKLPLFNVHDPPRMRRRDQQVRLSTEEGRDLQHVHKLRRQGRLMRLVNIRHGRDAQPLAHLAEDAERALIADAREGVNTRSIRLAIRPLEDIRDTQPGRDLRHTLRNAQRHLLALNHARAGQEEELFCACQLIDVHCLSHSFDGLTKIISMSPRGPNFPAPPFPIPYI